MREHAEPVETQVRAKGSMDWTILRVYIEDSGRSSIYAAVEVDGCWEVGRKLVRDHGVWKPAANPAWRELGQTKWQSDRWAASRPNRDQLRRGTIEPHLSLIASAMKARGIDEPVYSRRGGERKSNDTMAVNQRRWRDRKRRAGDFDRR